MPKKISFGLSVIEVRKAIGELKAYQESINRKCEDLCQRLVNEGIQLARAEIGNSSFGNFIRLSSEISPTESGCKAVFYMEDASKITSQWVTLDGVQTAVVSPSLMIEFGSGLKAQNPKDIQGVGTGTFPGGTHGAEPGWYYMDLNNTWHYSQGIEPKMPMYKSGEELRRRVLSIAREVFMEDN